MVHSSFKMWFWTTAFCWHKQKCIINILIIFCFLFQVRLIWQNLWNIVLCLELLGFVDVTLFENLRFSRKFEKSSYVDREYQIEVPEITLSKFYHEIVQSLSYLRCRHFGRRSLFFLFNLLFWVHSHANSRSWIKFHLVSFRSGSEILTKKKVWI